MDRVRELAGAKARAKEKARAKKVRRERKVQRHVAYSIQCRTKEQYTCQLQLSVLLYNRSFAANRPIKQEDNRLKIGFRSSKGNITLHDLVRLHLPPVESRSQSEEPCKADQLFEAKRLFYIPRQLAHGCAWDPNLDVAKQKELAVFLRNDKTNFCALPCLKIFPLIPELAEAIASHLIKYIDWFDLKSYHSRCYAHASRKCLNEFFGGEMQLPEHDETPYDMYLLYSTARYDWIWGNDEIDDDLKSDFELSSPLLIEQLLSCRSEIALILDEPEKNDWAMFASQFQHRRCSFPEWVGAVIAE
ncbi:hypothetical protein F5Y16DRAFT_420830 [Xylariaceae sp. FL0255]|nr:hypothetical protein F5Y16DRAFT_420830 [Xylariaceae sp. FL0255]